MARFVAVLYIGFTGVFAWVAIVSKLPREFIKLPQWMLLIPISVMALVP